MYQLENAGFAQKAMNDPSLYETIVTHRMIFTKVGGVNYQLHQPQTIHPIPPDYLVRQWETDYKIMREQMIYGDSPSFDELINGIQAIKEMINESKWSIHI